MNHQHTYWKRHPRNFENEYEILSLPRADGPPQADGWKKLSRDQALTMARWTAPKNQTEAVTVNPCLCGDCALSQYAENHSRSATAARVEFIRKAQIDRQRHRDRAILGPNTPEYREKYDPIW